MLNKSWRSKYFVSCGDISISHFSFAIAYLAIWMQVGFVKRRLMYTTGIRNMMRFADKINITQLKRTSIMIVTSWLNIYIYINRYENIYINTYVYISRWKRPILSSSKNEEFFYLGRKMSVRSIENSHVLRICCKLVMVYLRNMASSPRAQ